MHVGRIYSETRCALCLHENKTEAGGISETHVNAAKYDAGSMT